MSEELGTIRESIGVLRGELSGVKSIQADQREDIQGLHGDIETLRRDMAVGFKDSTAAMAKCFAEQELRMKDAFQSALNAALAAQGTPEKRPGPIAKTFAWGSANPTAASVIGLLTAGLLFASGRGDLIPAFIQGH